MTYRITHVDHLERRRTEVKQFENASAAASWAEAVYGPARYLAVIRLRGVM